jgi:Rieske Fe-S protein
MPFVAAAADVSSCLRHASQYDISGRIRKAAAPFNPYAPTYAFNASTKLTIG